MQFIDATRSVERQRFFDGQRLFASDLQSLEGFNREMRWLHNQSLHQPGIGNGFAVSGKKDDREVNVGAGYAIDDLGREIVLTSSRTIPVPPVAGDGHGNPQRFLLTVQYPDDADLEEVERRHGICDTDGAVRLREEPIFCWVPLNAAGAPSATEAGDILKGRQLVLTEAAVRDCKLAKDISIVQRRNARPPTQPFIACGSAVPTPWEDWDLIGDDVTLRFDALGIIGGIQAEIDTTSAGFHTPPDYFARIDGPRIMKVTINESDHVIVLDGLLTVTKPSARGFTAQVVVLGFAAPHEEVTPTVTVLRESFGGYDISALTGPVPFIEAATTSTSEPREDDDSLAVFLRDWTVGWMGVEG